MTQKFHKTVAILGTYAIQEIRKRLQATWSCSVMDHQSEAKGAKEGAKKL